MANLRRTLAVLAVASTGLTALGTGGGVAAQSAPTLSVTPTRVAPGQAITITVADCPVVPTIEVGESDTVRAFDGSNGAMAGTTTVTVPGGQVDMQVSASCGSATLTPVLVDVDNPMIGLNPIGSFRPEPDAAARVYGSDCPDGTTAQVRFDSWDFGASGPSRGQTVEVPIDALGDWQVDVPPVPAYAVLPPAGTPAGTVLRELRMTASCGEVTYADLRIPIQVATGDERPPVPPSGPPVTVTPPPPTAPPVVAPAPPAAPRPGSAAYTG